MDGNDEHGAGRGQDDHHDLIDEVSAGLRARAAMTPRSADPFGPVGAAIAAGRRRRTVYGAALAVVAVVGASITVGRLGFRDGAGNGSTANGQQAVLAPGVVQSSTTAGTPAPPTSATSRTAASPPTNAGVPSRSPSSQSMWKVPTWPLNYPVSSSFTASEPTVDAMIAAYGQPVGSGARHVLLNLVDSFHVCGYNLSSYTFKLRWAGDLAHSGGHGAVVVDVTRGGATFRMLGYDTYKGVLLNLPFQLTGDEAAHFEGADGEFDEPAQSDYEIVTAAPGSTVTVSVQSSASPLPAVTVGPSGVAEIQTHVLGRGDAYEPAVVTAVTVTRPDGSTGSVPQPSYSDAAERAARQQLLPPDTVCPAPQSR